VEPVFLLSLPRAGSTLLQRMLAAHPEIASSAEPWVLLPFLYTLRRDGVRAEYGHSTAVTAIEEFARFHLGGRAAYLAEGRRFFLRLYEHAADGRRYFLDKTPRYHLVAHELLELFPAARVVFLWRNPLAVVASIIDSWNRGHWNLDTHRTDLYRGVERLTDACAEAGGRAVTVRYEDLLEQPEAELRRVLDALGLAMPAGLVDSFAGVTFPGSMGDTRGTAAYASVSREPLSKWQQTLANPVRRAWARRYLDWIGQERLATMGYDRDELRRQLDSVPLQRRETVGDVGRIVYRSLRRRVG
jgi:hypothetical protein